MGLLDGKVALITGGARGQGRSHALALAREGADIAVCDISTKPRTTFYDGPTAADLKETERLVHELDRRCLAMEADVTDRTALGRFVDATIEQLGPIDIVCANAGIVSYNSFWETTDEQWDDTIATNMTGVWNTVRACARHMITAGRGGSMVLTSSVAAFTPAPGASAYVAAKNGVVGIMKSAAVELAQFNIRVNSIHPCTVNTPMVINQPTRDMFGGRSGVTHEDVEPAMRGLVLLPQTMAEPEDISSAVLYLVSDAGRAVTGVALPVDLGMQLVPPGGWR